MKRTVRKQWDIGSLSPITKGGEVVNSRIKMITDPNKPTEQWVEEYTPEPADAIKVLEFLNEMNGIGWTSRLRKAEEELRLALHDLMTIGGTDK